MSAHPVTPSFGHGFAVALALSLAGAALFAALQPWLGAGTAARAIVALAGLAYVLYLIARSGERVGRISTVAGAIVVSGLAAALDLPFAGYVLAHVGLVWLVRSLYYYAGLLPALADLGVSLLGAAFAASAAARSGSPWLALWCFFLVQAFHTLIPPSLTQAAAAEGPDDAFVRAQRIAEAAVQRLSSGL